MRRFLTTSLLVGFGLISALSVTQNIQAVNAQEQSEKSSLMAKGERGPSGRRGGGIARLCQEDGIEGHIERMSEAVGQLDLTDTQEQYWNDFVNTAGTINLEEACESGDRAAVREVGQEMREQRRTFFDSLSDEQREELRELKPERPERQNGNRNVNRQGQR